MKSKFINSSPIPGTNNTETPLNRGFIKSTVQTTVQMGVVKAKLNCPKGAKDCYAHARFYDPVKKKRRQYKERGKINEIKDHKEQLRYGKILVRDLDNLIATGWNPYAVESSTYVGKSLLDLFDEFYKIKEGTLRSRSLDYYKYALNLFKEYLAPMSTILPEDFSSPMAHAFSDWLITVKKQKGRNHNNNIEAVSNFFNTAVDKEIIFRNPFKKVKKKTVDKGKNYAFSDRQRLELKKYLQRTSPNMYMFVQFIYYCYIRPNELVQLKIKHLNTKDSIIIIPSEISKNRKQSSVEIPKDFLEDVRNYFVGCKSEMYLFGRGIKPGEKKMWRNRVSEAHRKALDDLNIGEEHNLYSWKHTGVVAAVKSRMDLDALRRQLRHNSLDEMMVYLESLGLRPNSEFTSKMKKF